MVAHLLNLLGERGRGPRGERQPAQGDGDEEAARWCASGTGRAATTTGKGACTSCSSGWPSAGAGRGGGVRGGAAELLRAERARQPGGEVPEGQGRWGGGPGGGVPGSRGGDGRVAGGGVEGRGRVRADRRGVPCRAQGLHAAGRKGETRRQGRQQTKKGGGDQ